MGWFSADGNCDDNPFGGMSPEREFCPVALSDTVNLDKFDEHYMERLGEKDRAREH